MKRHHYVYVIQDGEFCKIGHAGEPESRLLQITTSNPREVKLAHKFRFSDRTIALAVESETHRTLRDLRVSGEWFQIDPVDAHRAIERACLIVGSFTFDRRDGICIATGALSVQTGYLSVDNDRRRLREKMAAQSDQQNIAVTGAVTRGNAPLPSFKKT